MRITWILTVAICVVPLTANRVDAVGAVYFTASPASSNSSIIHQAGIGEALELECDLYAASVCEWGISMWYDNFDGGAQSWGLDIGLLHAQLFNRYSVSNVQIPINDITQFVGPYQTNQPNGLLIENGSGSNVRPAGAGPALWNVMNFRLSENSPIVETDTSNIYARVSGPEFGGNDYQGFGFYEVVRIGPNDPWVGYQSSGWPAYALPNAVITINNVPEPVALSLIGVGGLVILRRRN